MTEILQTSPEIGGMGHSVKRKEDPRFIRGKGEYIDDLTLPGMLWLDIVRSPYAHATIKGIDASEALKIPGVAAVVTGKDLEGYKLHWMPTLAGDMQMVLPTDTVMYQSQEVAAVIATSRYAAADGVAAVLVDYEPLPVIVDPHKALSAYAAVPGAQTALIQGAGHSPNVEKPVQTARLILRFAKPLDVALRRSQQKAAKGHATKKRPKAGAKSR